MRLRRLKVLLVGTEGATNSGGRARGGAASEGSVAPGSTAWIGFAGVGSGSSTPKPAAKRRREPLRVELPSRLAQGTLRAPPPTRPGRRPPPISHAPPREAGTEAASPWGTAPGATHHATPVQGAMQRICFVTHVPRVGGCPGGRWGCVPGSGSPAPRCQEPGQAGTHHAAGRFACEARGLYGDSEHDLP